MAGRMQDTGRPFSKVSIFVCTSVENGLIFYQNIKNAVNRLLNSTILHDEMRYFVMQKVCFCVACVVCIYFLGKLITYHILA